MAVDFKVLLDRLAAHQLTVVTPAIADPSIAKAAAVTGMLLQQAACAIDEAPGRHRRRIEDMEHLIAACVGHIAVSDQLQDLLEVAVDRDSLSGLRARELDLQAALIAVSAAIEGDDADWATVLRSDIRAAFLRWTA